MYTTWGVSLVVGVLVIAGMWTMFAKAGRPGWAAIIPIYNTYVLTKVAGRPGWWLILYFIPLINVIFALIILYDLSKAFGHGFWTWLGLWLLPFIFFPVVGLGSSRYTLPKYRSTASSPSGAMPTPE